MEKKYIYNITELKKFIDNKYLTENINSSNCLINRIIFFGSKGELGKPESKMFKEAIRKYKNIEVTYIFNQFVYFFDNDNKHLTISYIDENTKKESEIKIKYTDNLKTLFVYKSIHPDLWGEYLYSFSKLLSANYFFQLNPPHLSKNANDKFLSYLKLEQYNIKQPKSIIIEKNDLDMYTESDDIHIGGKNTVIYKLGSIYNIKAKTIDDLDGKEFVVKLLNGSHGIGVFLCNNKQIIGILQTAFALDNNLQLLVQAKENTIDGDLRVHVLTLNSGQFILAAMKRKKIKSDFRSNYSLGADIEEVELTQDQIELAKRVAAASELPWCAVDIMPIKNEDNVDDNVIIEYNQNPGVEGISKVLGKNFFNLLLDNLFKELSADDFYKQKYVNK